MRRHGMVPGGHVHLRGVHHGPGLAADGKDFPVDDPHLRHGGAAGAGGKMDRPMAVRDTGRALKVIGQDDTPWSALYGPDIHCGIHFRSVAEVEGDVPLGLYGEADEYKWTDTAGLCSAMVCNRITI